MYNKIVIVGNVGQDPEVRHLEGGNAVCTFSVATTEKYKDKENTTWHRVQCWGKVAEIMEKHLTKGMTVLVEGPQHHRQWEDKDGNKKWQAEISANNIKFLGRKPQNSSNSQTSAAPAPAGNVEEDDLPF